MDAYLKTEHLDAGYDGKALLHDVCLRVQRGRIVTLIGPNGSGKSTILKTIISQLPAIGGSVLLDGQDLRKQSRSDIARRMAILMTARMNPELMSCRDVVSSGRYPYTGRLAFCARKTSKSSRNASGRPMRSTLPISPSTPSATGSGSGFCWRARCASSRS